MKIKLLTIILLSTILNANVTIQQNIKALYKGVNLTSSQLNYILDNQEYMKKVIQSKANKEMNKENKKQSINEKNVIEFILMPNGNIKEFKFLKRSSNSTYNNYTRHIIEITAQELPKPTTEIPLRYIVKYEYGNRQEIKSNKSSKTENPAYEEEQLQRIPKGTNRFQYSSEEYVRTFEVRNDGFMNITNNMCANITILTMQNQRVRTGYANWSINEPIEKGQYKMLIKTKKNCDINVQYP